MTFSGRSKLRQTKIEDLGVTQLGHKYVCWLDVSMNYSLGMCCPERISNLNCQFQHFLELKGLTMDVMLQRFAVEELHRNEVLASLLTNVVNGADVRVDQC